MLPLNNLVKEAGQVLISMFYKLNSLRFIGPFFLLLSVQIAKIRCSTQRDVTNALSQVVFIINKDASLD